MQPIADILHYGTPWWVRASLVQIGATGIELVKPPTTTAHGPDYSPVTRGSHNKIEDYRIILLGWEYHAIGTDTAGFDLFWADLITSPGGTTRRNIITPRAATGALTLANNANCFIGGIHGNISPRNAASLWVAESGDSAITNGYITCWGIFTTADFRPHIDYTGSPPINFSPTA